MNILFINNYFPIFEGTDSGASNRSTMFITALSKIGHVDIISFRSDSMSPNCGCGIIYNKEITTCQKEKRLGKLLKLFAYYSPEKIYLLNIEKESIVDSYIQSGKYDFIACRYLREAVECGLLKYSKKLIIDVDDNPKDVILMAAKNAKTFRNRVYNRLFSYTMDKMVKYVLENVYCSFHSNPLQAPVSKSIYLHNVTMTDVILPPTSEQTPLQIMMVGLFHYGPNIEGLEHFLSKVWPLVRQCNQSIKLHVVGRIANEQLRQKWSSVDGVVLKGFVPDLLEEYKQSRVVIIPIYSGSGTSVKVVEAMTMNRVCVSTPQGVRGYDKFIVDEEDFLLAKNDEEFANKILNLVMNVDSCNKLAKSARQKIELYFSKNKFIDIVVNAINNN